MRKTDVVIIGGGQSGLVMSRSLGLRNVDHVVLERGRTGERWHSERWKSLRLLTTNALSALPGLAHAGDPEAFMPACGFAAYLGRYARHVAAPVVHGAEVLSVTPGCGGFRVATTMGDWRCRAVVIATGACDVPYRPPMAEHLASEIHQVLPSQYRAPEDLPEGGVLVVGASSTGLQLAEEIRASGRPVTLAVGEHTRVPRRYRGGDIYAWMEFTGMLDEPALQGGNLEAARRQPSLQLVGRPDKRNLDLEVLTRHGVKLAGRLAHMSGTVVECAGDLGRTTARSHQRMLRILDRIDEAIVQRRVDAPRADALDRDPFLAEAPVHRFDLGDRGIRTVVWATGYVRRYPWLHLPALDSRGELNHAGGVTPVPGLYVLGLTFLRRRRSSFIDGCGLDAEDLAPVIKSQLDFEARQVA